jgi:FkbM family methyltransferase
MHRQEMSATSVRRVRIGAREIAVADRKESFWDRVAAGAWEPELVAALCQLARPGRLVVDIGAWVGPVTLLSAACGAEVVAFEPDPEAFAQLGGNVAANPGLSARIDLHPAAVQPLAGLMHYGSARKPGDGMGGALWAGGGVARREVPAVGVPEVMALVAGRPGFLLKLDIEGGEYALLPALAPLLDMAGDVLVSLHPKVLRQATGASEAEVERATGAALAALAAFDLAFLDHDRQADVTLSEAMRRDCALLGRRRQA